MSLEKSIQFSKEKREQYRGAKAVDTTCRNHGSCDYCTKARQFFDTKKRKVLKEKLSTFYKEKFIEGDIVLLDNKFWTIVSICGDTIELRNGDEFRTETVERLAVYCI